MKQLLFVALLFLYVLTPAMAAVMSPIDYISAHSPLAIEEMNRSNIPASITLAQGIIESSWGGSDLAAKHKNHFGIKCNEWDGARTFHQDDDYDENGNLIESCFRSYYSVQESFKDHSNFLTRNQRYATLFTLNSNDYVGWAHGLKSCGYATDPAYAEKLIATIEEYGLQQFDNSNNVAPVAHAAPAVKIEVFHLPENYKPGMYDDTIADSKPAPKKAHAAPTYNLAAFKGNHNGTPKKKTTSQNTKVVIVRKSGKLTQMSTKPRSKSIRRN